MSRYRIFAFNNILAEVVNTKETDIGIDVPSVSKFKKFNLIKN